MSVDKPISRVPPARYNAPMMHVPADAAASAHDAVFDRTLFPPPAVLAMPAVGVDVSSRVVRSVALKRSGSGYAVTHCTEYPLGKGAIAKGEIENIGSIAEKLSTLKKEYGFRFAHAALPEERAYLFQTEIPETAEGAALHDMIEFRLEENVPLQPQNAIFDYEPIGNEAQSHIFNVAVFPRETVERYTAAFHRAGIIPLSLETEAHAITRALVPRGDTGTHLILDVGTQSAHVIIVSNGVPQFTSSVEVGGEAFVGTVSRGFEVAPDEAEYILAQRTLRQMEKDNSAVHQALQQQLQKLYTEVGRYISYWHSRTKGGTRQLPPIEQVILCGGGANMAELPALLSTNVGVPTGRGNVWTNVLSFDDAIPPIDYERSLSYAVAMGLALKGVPRS